MTTSVSDFDYDLPKDRIAQSPIYPREEAKLMVLDRKNGTIQNFHVADLPKFFRKEDVVVLNNTKVFHARLHGQIQGKIVELFLIRPQSDNTWLALGKPGKKFTLGTTIAIAKDFSAVVQERYPDGTFSVILNETKETIIEKANIYGDVPIPPYIKKITKDSDYQTIYAKYNGSVAAPTAGFHFSKPLLSTLKKIGVTILEITLHVGIGTFMPIKTQTIESHEMHSEWVNLPENIAETINKAKKNKQRIIAIGTTTVRTLEGVAALNNGILKKYQGDINLFITPGFTFNIVDAMLTNFHLPKSTLIVLVSAFAGRKNVLNAYQVAVNNNYRFYSFGDAMLII